MTRYCMIDSMVVDSFIIYYFFSRFSLGEVQNVLYKKFDIQLLVSGYTDLEDYFDVVRHKHTRKRYHIV